VLWSLVCLVRMVETFGNIGAFEASAIRIRNENYIT
jgi:hypothetical protein